MEIPLTSFIDFVLKSGSPKLTCARQIKQQMNQPYDPAADYYKRFREGIQEMHSQDIDKKLLSRVIGKLPDNKVEHYNSMIAGYKKFLGNKDATWFEPPRKVWNHNNIQVPVNPEVGLTWDNSRYIIKLYLKAEKLTKDRIGSILALMNSTLTSKGCQYGLLDVRNSKLYLFETNMTNLMVLVEGEADSLESIIGRI